MITLKSIEPILFISIQAQTLQVIVNKQCVFLCTINSAKNGTGQAQGSEKTPLGWHTVCKTVGVDSPLNAVFISREFTGEIYSKELANKYPNRDWILTRILRLSGLEPGFNHGGDVDTFNRYIYIHGCPDETCFKTPSSHGCIRAKNKDIVHLSSLPITDAKVFIYE